MGVKSTVTLTRAEAEERFIAFVEQRERCTIRDLAARLSNADLANLLESWNDEAHDGEGFENYMIS